MNSSTLQKFRFFCLAPAFLFLSACGSSPEIKVQGYAEGEYIYVASPFGGTLNELSVKRGGSVKSGDLLFTLDNEFETAARDEAAQQLTAAQAKAADIRKGLRPSEIDALTEQIRQANAGLLLAEKDWQRQVKLSATKASTQEEIDRARSNRDSARARVLQLEAELKTAQLGAREDQIAAAEADVQSRTANLKQAQWALDQKSKRAQESALVFDTLYEVGEWVAGGRPVVVLLPPNKRKVRIFVPEPYVAKIHLGDEARVHTDGVESTLVGKVSYISPKAEYTPPVIFSEESRSKLVFMVELRFEDSVAENLHPGQPVDVEFGS